MRDQKLMKRVKFACHSSERRLHHNKTVVRILDTAESLSWEGFFSGKGLGGLWVDRGLGKMVGQLIGQGDVSVGINPFAAGGLFGWYKMIQKHLKDDFKSWHMGTHLRVLIESYPMNINMTGFIWFSIIFAPSCFRWK